MTVTELVSLSTGLVGLPEFAMLTSSGDGEYIVTSSSADPSGLREQMDIIFAA
jgi:hypothetical protein